MADGNNLRERLQELAQNAAQHAEKVSGAIAESFNDLTSIVATKVADAIHEQATKVDKSGEVDVETTDKILNGAMNNSRFEIKVSLAEGILNGLFCGSLITVNIHNYAAPEKPVSEVAETEGS